MPAVALARAALLPALLLAVCGVAGAEPSPAERRIAAARSATDAHPERAGAWSGLALAYARRARETADTAFYDEAEQAAGHALALAPGDLEAEKAQVWILLGKHEFARAREQARVLRERAPNDILVHGFLADASAELGDYAEAERAVQAMLDLRPGNVAGLTRAAYLRELFGDVEGAIELMQTSYERLPAAETEDRAWVLTQVGHLRLVEGQVEEAERALEQALALFPDYHYALAGLARVRSAQGSHAEAVDLLRRRYAAAPHPENLYELARALERAGRPDEARAAYRSFEEKARAESERADNCNRELVLYYVDRARRPEEALRVAERERRRRDDVFTRDAHAWALHANGRTQPARSEIERALEPGSQDATLLYHAGMIALAQDDAAAAAAYLGRAAAPGAPPEIADAARRELEALAARRPVASR